ncbi:MAG TPA: putative C-S lyase [Chloroflexi bacterium]|nr:putative C-S lyase [Chloroflexota bacterium]
MIHPYPELAELFDFLPDRRHSESIKWLQYPEDVLPLWVADMDFISPEPVIRAIQERAAHGVFGYPTDMPVLIEAIQAWLAERHGWQVRQEDIVLLPGVVTGINLVAHAIGQPGDGVLIQTPIYPPFLTAPENAGRVRHDAPMVQGPDGRFEVDFDAFEQAMTDDTRLFILCNPHNPVGRVYTRMELERMAEICLRRGVTICSDEIHCDLVYSGNRHTPIASLDEEIARHTVTLMSPSKTFNIAGLVASYAVIPNPELRRQVMGATQGLVGHVNLLGQVAAHAAYTQGKPWLEALLAYLEANRDFLVKFVTEELPGVRVTVPEGTYLAWLDFRGVQLPDPPGKYFLRQARVALSEGTYYGKEGAGFARLNFGCPRSVLEEALERMRRVFSQR